jgi:hypothetical protein
MDPRRARCELEPDPLAARAAREFVASTCRDWQLTAELDTLVLLTSELVTNGVLHARTPLLVDVQADGDVLTIEVHDNDPRPPTPRDRRSDLLADIDELIQRHGVDLPRDERHSTLHAGPAGAIGAGRGLLLVEALADEWGVELTGEGKSVWFRLAA